jgi:signal transduction histidine kinase
MAKSAIGVTVSRLIGLIVFLILLAIANVISFNSYFYTGIVGFFNTKILVIIFFTLLLYLGELFFVFGFPINMPAPIFNAFGGAFLVSFIFDLFAKLGSLMGTNALYALRPIEWLLVIIVFLLALIIGYVRVFSEIGSKKKEKKKIKKKIDEEHDWDDIKREIKTAVYHATKNLSDKLKPEEESEEKKTSKKKVSRKKK